MKPLICTVLVVPLLALSGCGGGGSAAETSTAARTTDPCELLTPADVAKVTGEKVTASAPKPSESDDGHTETKCEFTWSSESRSDPFVWVYTFDSTAKAAAYLTEFAADAEKVPNVPDAKAYINSTGFVGVDVGGKHLAVYGYAEESEAPAIATLMAERLSTS